MKYFLSLLTLWHLTFNHICSQNGRQSQLTTGVIVMKSIYLERVNEQQAAPGCCALGIHGRVVRIHLLRNLLRIQEHGRGESVCQCRWGASHSLTSVFIFFLGLPMKGILKNDLFQWKLTRLWPGIFNSLADRYHRSHYVILGQADQFRDLVDIKANHWA